MPVTPLCHLRVTFPVDHFIRSRDRWLKALYALCFTINCHPTSWNQIILSIFLGPSNRHPTNVLVLFGRATVFLSNSSTNLGRISFQLPAPLVLFEASPQHCAFRHGIRTEPTLQKPQQKWEKDGLSCTFGQDYRVNQPFHMGYGWVTNQNPSLCAAELWVISWHLAFSWLFDWWCTPNLTNPKKMMACKKVSSFHDPDIWGIHLKFAGGMIFCCFDVYMTRGLRLIEWYNNVEKWLKKV